MLILRTKKPYICMYLQLQLQFTIVQLQYWTKKLSRHVFFNFSTSIDSFATSDISAVVIIQGKYNYIARLSQFSKLKKNLYLNVCFAACWKRFILLLITIAIGKRQNQPARFSADIFVKGIQQCLKRSQIIA